MATLEQQRRAIGANNEAARRAIGINNAAERRGARLVEDLNRTVRPERQGNSLPVLERRGSQPAQRGRGAWDESKVQRAGAGIASPLTEKTSTDATGKAVPQREYWPTGLYSSDGLFMIPRLKTLNLLDANGAEVQIQLGDAGLIT